MAFLPSYIYVIAASFLISLTIFYRFRSPDSYIKLFPPFLLATLLVELLGSYRLSLGENNLTLYNFFTTFEFCFYLWIINSVIQNTRMKKIIRITIPFYAVIATLNILFVQKMETFHTVSYAFGCLLIVAFCIYYFFELFRLPMYVKLINNPALWICSALLFFYCCTFPLYGLANYWLKSGISKLLLKNFTEIIAILNIFLYTLFTISFLCIRTRKYTLSPS